MAASANWKERSLGTNKRECYTISKQQSNIASGFRIRRLGGIKSAAVPETTGQPPHGGVGLLLHELAAPVPGRPLCPKPQ